MVMLSGECWKTENIEMDEGKKKCLSNGRNEEINEQRGDKKQRKWQVLC